MIARQFPATANFFSGSRQQKFVRRLLEQNSIQDKMFFEVIVLR